MPVVPHPVDAHDLAPTAVIRHPGICAPLVTGCPTWKGLMILVGLQFPR